MAIAAGIPDELFWRSTLGELEEILARKMEQERARYMRAALVAATIVNVNRRKGSRLVRPSDFIRVRPRPEDYMSPEQAAKFMMRWASEQNAAVADRKLPPSEPQTKG